jgi:hypothetical protein
LHYDIDDQDQEAENCRAIQARQIDLSGLDFKHGDINVLGYLHGDPDHHQREPQPPFCIMSERENDLRRRRALLSRHDASARTTGQSTYNFNFNPQGFRE